MAGETDWRSLHDFSAGNSMSMTLSVHPIFYRLLVPHSGPGVQLSWRGRRGYVQDKSLVHLRATERDKQPVSLFATGQFAVWPNGIVSGLQEE